MGQLFSRVRPRGVACENAAAVPKPPFAGPQWRRRASAVKRIGRRVWYDPETGYESFRDPDPAKGTWHEVDPRHGLYREIDEQTGRPVAGGESRWRPLR